MHVLCCQHFFFLPALHARLPCVRGWCGDVHTYTATTIHTHAHRRARCNARCCALVVAALCWPACFPTPSVQQPSYAQAAAEDRAALRTWNPGHGADAARMLVAKWVTCDFVTNFSQHEAAAAASSIAGERTSERGRERDRDKRVRSKEGDRDSEERKKQL